MAIMDLFFPPKPAVAPAPVAEATKPAPVPKDMAVQRDVAARK